MIREKEMLRVVVLTTVFLFGFVLSGVSVWSDGLIDDADFITRFDADGDGLVAAEEFDGPPDHFIRLDLDGDGYIDAAEMPAHPPHGPAEATHIVEDFDADGDGLLAEDEFPGPLNLFDDLDTDGDGLLSADEISMGSPPPRADGFAADDTDLDGQVSLAEFSGPASLFDHLDADGDGYITPGEAWPDPPMDDLPEQASAESALE